MARKQAGWHAENIKAELRKRCGTLTAFGQSVGVKQQNLSDTIASPNGSARVERLIAEALAVPLHELWPDRWTADGLKIDRAQYRRERRMARAVA